MHVLPVGEIRAEDSAAPWGEVPHRLLDGVRTNDFFIEVP